MGKVDGMQMTSGIEPIGKLDKKVTVIGKGLQGSES